MALPFRRISPAVIRSLRADRSEECAAVHAAAFAHPWPADEFAALLRSASTIGSAALDPLTNRLRGFAVSRLAADEAEILSIAVAASHRGRGLSRNLLLTHLGHLARRGVRTVFLEVEENNQPARRLYERAGFAVVGRRERYYRQPDGEQLSALLMRRDLS